jgi:hypothetical protein
MKKAQSKDAVEKKRNDRDENAEGTVIQKTTTNQPPKRSDFNIPETENELKEMIEVMTRCGIKPNEAEPS